MYRYLSILIFSIAAFAALPVYAQVDTAGIDTVQGLKVRKHDTAGHQLELGVDIFHPILNQFQKDRYTYEFVANYYLRNEFYAAFEGGWGGTNVDYPDLKYTTSNSFFRAGFNKSILVRDRPSDWDMMFIGMRVAAADIQRSSATFSIVDSTWGTTPTMGAPGKSFWAYWIEVTGGVRVEIVKGLIAGWNIRGKFLMNGKSFKDLAPLSISGYGKGDKNAVFDFNVYISYGIRWNRKHTSPAK